MNTEEQLKQAGMEATARHASNDWKKRVLGVLKLMAECHREVNAEVLRRACDAEGLSQPPNANIWGWVISHGAEKGWIERAGYTVKSGMPGAHGREIAVWRSRIFIESTPLVLQPQDSGQRLRSEIADRSGAQFSSEIADRTGPEKMQSPVDLPVVKPSVTIKQQVPEMESVLAWKQRIGASMLTRHKVVRSGVKVYEGGFRRLYALVPIDNVPTSISEIEENYAFLWVDTEDRP